MEDVRDRDKQLLKVWDRESSTKHLNFDFAIRKSSQEGVDL